MGQKRPYFTATLSIILVIIIAIGYGLAVVGIFNLLSAFGIVNIFPSTSLGPVEVDGDSTTGWICLSIGILIVLSATAIKRKYNLPQDD